MLVNNIHLYQSRVYMPDTDGSGIVYHANYLKFCDQARTEWMRELGFGHYLTHQTFIFVVTEANLSYKRSLRMDQTFSIESRCLKVAGARMYLEQKVISNDEVICMAQIIMATLDKNHHPIRIPKQLSQKLLSC